MNRKLHCEICKSNSTWFGNVLNSLAMSVPEISSPWTLSLLVFNISPNLIFELIAYNILKFSVSSHSLKCTTIRAESTL